VLVRPDEFRGSEVVNLRGFGLTRGREDFPRTRFGVQHERGRPVSRWAEHVEDARLDAEQAEWLSTHEGQAVMRREEQARREREQVRAEEARRKAERERRWAIEHPTEWAAWLWLQPVWNRDIDFFTPPPEYTFADFLAEVGPAPSNCHRIERKDESKPYQPGNLRWSLLTAVETPYLTLDEAAAYCRLKPKTLYNHRHEIRSLPGVGKLLFLREELDRWLATRRTKKKEARDGKTLPVLSHARGRNSGRVRPDQPEGYPPGAVRRAGRSLDGVDHRSPKKD
jgi:hypothetical protein